MQAAGYAYAIIGGVGPAEFYARCVGAVPIEAGLQFGRQPRDAAHAVREHIEARGAEVINQTKQQVSDAYQQTSKSVSEQYAKAVDYGHENPGITTLIALGVGVGIGLLLAGSVNAVRKRE